MSKTPTRMTAVEQALRIWPVLVDRAVGSRADEAKITYGDLVVAIGYPNKKAAQAIKRALGLVGWYCLKSCAPTLNSLVVNRGTKEAGESVVVHPGRTPEQERVNVVSFDWQVVQQPTASALQAIDAEHRTRRGSRRKSVR